MQGLMTYEQHNPHHNIPATTQGNKYGYEEELGEHNICVYTSVICSLMFVLNIRLWLCFEEKEQRQTKENMLINK